MNDDALNVLASHYEAIAAEFRKLAASSRTPLAVLPHIAHSQVNDMANTTNAESQTDGEMISASELAEILGVKPRSVSRWASSGKLPKPLKVGGIRRWRRSTIELWMKDRSR